MGLFCEVGALVLWLRYSIVFRFSISQIFVVGLLCCQESGLLKFTDLIGIQIPSIFENEIPISGLGGKIDFYDEKLLSKNNHRCTSSSKRNRAPIFFVVVFSETLIHASKFFRIHDHNRQYTNFCYRLSRFSNFTDGTIAFF